MIWFVVMHLFSRLFGLIRIGRLNEEDKDLEILLLRQQLGIAERKVTSSPSKGFFSKRYTFCSS
jgi:hypothetical protein